MSESEPLVPHIQRQDLAPGSPCFQLGSQSWLWPNSSMSLQNVFWPRIFIARHFCSHHIVPGPAEPPGQMPSSLHAPSLISSRQKMRRRGSGSGG